MKKRKLVITQEQFKRLNEAEKNFNLTASITPGSVPDINKALDNADFRRALQATGADAKFIPTSNKGPSASPTVEVQADGAGNVTSLPAGVSNDAAIVVKNADNQGQTLEESYTKRAVEKMRVAKIMENGRRYAKKQIREVVDDDDYIDREELAAWCEGGDDFSYYIPIFGRRTGNANFSETQKEIANDVRNCDYLERTHEVDWVFGVEDDPSAIVVRLCGVKDSMDYYILWDKDE